MACLSWETTTISSTETEGERDRLCVGGRGDKSQRWGDLKYWRWSNHCNGVCSFVGSDGTFLFWWVTRSDPPTLLTSLTLVPRCFLSHFLSLSVSLPSFPPPLIWQIKAEPPAILITQGCDINTILWHYHATAWHRLSNERWDNKTVLKTHTHSLIKCCAICV